jgi:hypothetical protein
MRKKAKSGRATVAPARKERQVQEKRTFTLPLWLLPVLYSVVFVVMAWVFLVGKNADPLYYMQDRGYWNSSLLYFQQCMRMPGGFLAWAGSYLTQYFYYPAFGASLLIGLWMLCFLVAWRSFRVPVQWTFMLFVPLTALLCTIVQLGYWIYMLKDVDYAFYHSLGLFFALLLSVDYLRKVKYGSYIQMILVPVLCYHPLGVYALLATALLGVRILVADWRRGWPGLILAVALCATVPLIASGGTTLMRPDQVWDFGFKHFELGPVHDLRLEQPFVVVLVAPLLFPLLGWKFQGRPGRVQLAVSQLLMLVVLAGGWSIVSDRNFANANYHAEFRMLRAVDEQRWDDVLDEARSARENPSRQMVLYRDIALMQKGELLTHRYDYNNRPAPPSLASDSIVVRLCDTTGDFIYYNYGETCFGIRRAIERSMHYGFSYYTLRLLARCALVNREFDAVRKYLRLLDRTTFQHTWAEELRPYLADTSRIATDPRFRLVRKLYDGGTSMVGTDEYAVESTLIHKLAQTPSDDPEQLLLAMAYCLQEKDLSHFWAQVQHYHALFPEKVLPRYVQEAMLLFHGELKTGPADLSDYHIDPGIAHRYTAFIARVKEYSQSGMNADQMGAALRPEYGDTYWWDYCVLRNIQYF